MTFTFGEDLTVARDYVRFYSGDTVSPGFMSDELIASLITQQGSNNAAVIAGIRYIIRQLSRPDFTADWLTVSNSKAREGYEKMLKDAYTELGVNALSVSTVMTYRVDSYQTSDVDYDEDGTGDNA